MKATTLLTKQHRKIRTTFNKLERGSGDVEQLLSELANDLAAHMAIEQQIFYPAVAQVDPELLLESYEEHSLAEIALKRLMATDIESDSFKARVVAAKTVMMHHIDEEERTLFPKVERKLGDARLKELGQEMQERFEEIVEAGFEATLPRGYSRTSADASVKYIESAMGG